MIGLALFVQGCAGLIAGKDAAEAPATPAPPRIAPPGGRIELEKGRPGLVIAAPHGTSDVGTEVMARDLAELTRFGLVLATGYAKVDAEGRRFNVNRPTESVPGAAARLEVRTTAATAVYEAYRRHVTAAAQGALRLYVEVHGNSRPESAGRVEIATVGVSPADAWRLKTLLELIRDARIPREGDVPRLEVWMESQDLVWYTASAAKQGGILAQTKRALHIELPRLARTTHREAYTTVLADFLIQSAALLLPSR